MNPRRTLLYAMTAAMMLAEGVYDLVFALMAYGVSGQAASVATTYAIGFGAEIFVTVFGAGFLDYFDRRKLFAGTQVASVTVFATAFVFARTSALSENGIWLFAFLADLSHHASRLALFALVPTLFEKEELSQVQGTRAMISGVARVLAPVAGGVVIAGVGLHLSLAAVLVLSIVALAFALLLPGGSHVVVRRARSSIVLGALGTLRAVRAIARDASWRRFSLLVTTSQLVIAVAILLWVPLLRSVHGVSEAETGSYVACGALGMVASGFALRSMRATSVPQRVLTYSLLLAAAGLMLMVTWSGPVLRIGATLLFYVGLTLFLRTNEVALQQTLPADRFASFYGAMDAGGRVLGLAGILCAGRIFDRIGGSAFYGALVVLLLVLAVLWSKRLVLVQSPLPPPQSRAQHGSLSSR